MFVVGAVVRADRFATLLSEGLGEVVCPYGCQRSQPLSTSQLLNLSTSQLLNLYTKKSQTVTAWDSSSFAMDCV